MALLNRPIQVAGQLPKFFETLRSGTAPPSFTRQFLKDLGYKSSNHLEFIPLLKGLGFLTADGSPTERYRQFLDATRWKQVMGEAVKEAYGDIFILKARPTNSDLQMITGKFKSTYNLSDLQSERAARTFLALLNLSDADTLYGAGKVQSPPQQEEKLVPEPLLRAQEDTKERQPDSEKRDVGLHYNIQIHLPATKDIEVYNAIFKSLREHIIE